MNKRVLVTGGSGYFGESILNKLIDKGYECSVLDINSPDQSILEKVKNYQLDEISITSSFELHEITSNSVGFSLEEVSDVKIEVSKTSGQQCQRCWKYKKQLIRDEICGRCDNAIS